MRLLIILVITKLLARKLVFLIQKPLTYQYSIIQIGIVLLLLSTIMISTNCTYLVHNILYMNRDIILLFSIRIIYI